MLQGIDLNLFIGANKPSPVPLAIIESLESVQVSNSKDRSGFQLSFTIGKKSKLIDEYFSKGYFDPVKTRVIIKVSINTASHYLIDGFITNQELSPSNSPGESKLTVTGEDFSLLMDLVKVRKPAKNMSLDQVVTGIINKYSKFGLKPDVKQLPVKNRRSRKSGWYTQNQTDRATIKRIADKCGYLFYIKPGPKPGECTAYFGPEIKPTKPEPALSVNMDAFTNVESLSFSYNGLAKKERKDKILDKENKKKSINVSEPDVKKIKGHLGAKPAPTTKIIHGNKAAKLSTPEAIIEQYGFKVSNSATLTANGSLDVLRYNHLLSARSIVGVRGAGSLYDGLYYIDSVTHNIKGGEYKQSFTLSRDGLGADRKKLNT